VPSRAVERSGAQLECSAVEKKVWQQHGKDTQMHEQRVDEWTSNGSGWPEGCGAASIYMYMSSARAALGLSGCAAGLQRVWVCGSRPGPRALSTPSTVWPRPAARGGVCSRTGRPQRSSARGRAMGEGRRSHSSKTRAQRAQCDSLAARRWAKPWPWAGHVQCSAVREGAGPKGISRGASAPLDAARRRLPERC
jgi:hypothetical protein